MCKKSIYLTLLFFVFGLAWPGPANAADPNLMVWLEFEDNADDSSNYARHGTPVGEAYLPGVIGQAIDLGGADYVTIAGYKGVTGTHAFSIAAWVRTTDASGVLVGWGMTRGSGDDGQIMEFRPDNNRLRIEHGSGNVVGLTRMTDDEWHHVAVTVKENATMSYPDVKLYLDGFDDTVASTDDTPFDIASEFDVRIGREHDADFGRNWAGDIDDLRIYDRELTPREIRVMSGHLEPKLLEPANNEELTGALVTLKWVAGEVAADVNGHEIFLSDSFEDVNAGAGDALEEVMSGDANSYGPFLLDMGNVYYWRVNAVNDPHPDTPWKSEIWSFTVPAATAWEPYPEPGHTYIDHNVTLSWKPGAGGEYSDVYIGPNFADVNTSTDPNALKITDTTYAPGTLAFNTLYYWRIDTVMADGVTTIKGPVWSFTTQPDIPIADPNLIGWWKLDGMDPARAIDWSGHNNHGYLRGDPQWVPGYDANALEFDRDGDWVAISNLVYNSTGHPEVTVWAWVRTIISGDQAIASFDRDSYWRLEINGNGGGAGQVGWCVFTDAGQIDMGSSARVDDGEWHHVVGVFDNGWAGIFIDGRVDAQTVSGTTFGHGRTRYGFIGSRSEAGAFDGGTGTPNPFAGTLDDVRIYDRALSDDEVLRLIAPEKAYKPRPADGTQDVPLGSKLVWSPGTDESTGSPYTKHDVYFSENFEDVNSGTVPTATVTDVNEYTPTALDYYKYYYWRIDGINAADQANRGFIWSFKVTYDPFQIVDPNFVAWYKLDGDATDSSGYGRDLIVTGEPLYAGGVEDLAMELDDVDDWAVYEFPTEEWLKYTVMAWAKLDALPADNFETVFSSFGTTNTSGFQIDVNAATDTYRFNNVGSDEDGTFGPITTEWVHLAVAYDGARATLFYNGSDVDPVVYTAEGTFNQFGIGITRNRGTGRFGGKIDDVRVYDRELLDAEIRKAMRGDMARAWKPKPGHEATGVEREPTLSWTPGDYAPPTNGHYVYFGADDPCNLTLVPDQPQSPNNYSPGVLDLERTYYWAVDEANAGGVNPGKIWSFTITNHLSVDDMEAYNAWDAAPPYIFEVWVDGSGNCNAIAGNGTGSLVDFVADPCTPVLSGSQSMKLEYDNDGMAYNPCPGVQRDEPRAYYSKIVAQVGDFPSGIGSNWTAGGAKALSLQFFGDVNNVVEPMWIQLSDVTGPGAKVTYGDYEDEDPADVNDESWHEWNIALDDFTGVDAANVKSMTIGVGDELATSPAGTGTLYFDDIRLYTPRCFPLRAKSPADFDTSDNRCVVDYADLKVLTNDWLISGYDFTVADSVSDANLEAYYAFEDNLLDSSANLRHAVPNGTISYAAGKVGTLAVEFDGTNYAEVTGYKGVTGTQDRTCTAWIKTAIPGEIVIWGMNTSALKWIWRIQDNGAIRLEVATGSTVGKTDLRDDQWHHVAVVLESAGSPRVADLKLYVDGLLEAPSSLTDNDVNTSSDTDVRIGKGPFNERPFIGQIDELRIYSRALEQAEVANLAGLAGTVTQPLLLLLTTTENTDLFDDEKIDFKDYARLLDAWLDVVFWP